MVSMRPRLNDETNGQAILETAIMLPFLLGFVFNALNFGYFFLMAINVASAPREGVLYSSVGWSSTVSNELPDAGPTSDITTVSSLTLNDITGAIYNGASAQVQVCTDKNGTSGAGTALVTECTQYNGSAASRPDPDPEAPTFVLNRVDVTYTFQPLINQNIFNLVLLATPVCKTTGGTASCTFHRQVSMRAMN